jgi:prepilin-type N-terminal cleavage/methylation domain-containing protein
MQSRRHGFTLVEILVAATVLSLMVLLISVLMSSAASSVTLGRKRIDADSQARLIFSRMALDISAMVRRGDLDYSSFKSPNELQPGNDRFAFYSEGIGYFTGNGADFTSQDRSVVSLVSYAILSDLNRQRPMLQRMSKALGWSAHDSMGWRGMAYLPVKLADQWPALFGNDPDYTAVGSDVFRMEYMYLLKADLSDPANPKPARLSVRPWRDGASSVDGFKDVAAIVVAIGVLDPMSRVIVDPANTALAASLPDAVDGQDILSSWSAIVNSPNFASTAQILSPAAQAVRVYQRYFFLD